LNAFKHLGHPLLSASENLDETLNAFQHVGHA